MKIAIGSDHRGIKEEKIIAATLMTMGHEVKDFGWEDSHTPCDYPDIAAPVARAVAKGEFNLGILICGTGNGMAMAANKIKGIRAALAYSEDSAKKAKEHNNANILCLGTMEFTVGQLLNFVKIWLSAEYEGGRHDERVKKIMRLE